MSYPSFAHRLPLSPASPPELGVKQQPKAEATAIVRPRTPLSPDHMSVATKRYVSPYQDSRHTNEMADRPLPQPQRPSTSNNTLQSPTTLKRSLPQDVEEGPTSKRQRKEGSEQVKDEKSSYIAFNHDRQDQSFQARNVALPEDSNAHAFSEEGKAEMDTIFMNVGSSLRLRNTPRKKPLIDTSKHVLGTHGLHDLLSQVARKDPTTNEKINTLRKSYENQIRKAELSGRNKPHKQERTSENPDNSNMFFWATLPPHRFEEEMRVSSKVGDINAIRYGLRDALRLNSGTMDQKTQREWDETLGHEPSKPPMLTQQTPIPVQQQSRVPGQRQNHLPATLIEKPQTRGKKRGYRDDEFEGYGARYSEGISEPEMSDGDQDYAERGWKKRRKN